MKIDLIEHQSHCIASLEEDYHLVLQHEVRSLVRKTHKPVNPYQIRYNQDSLSIVAGYYAGIDWIIPDKKFIFVQPKVNAKLIEVFEQLTEADPHQQDEPDEKLLLDELIAEVPKELDLFRMLLDIYDGTIPENEIDPLIHIFWEDKPIEMNLEQDHLTPFLISQFLLVVKRIVQKGLKKSYYTVEENLESNVRGRILTGQQLRKNVFTGNHTKTWCSYQEFGINSVENKFLKHVLQFCSSFLSNHINFKDTDALRRLICYSMPAFELVGKCTDIRDLRTVTDNPFYKDYKAAIKLGEQILKRFDFQVSNTAIELKQTPPYWIDMPLLFELYVYRQLVKDNPELTDLIFYQKRTYGNILDFLVKGKKDAAGSWKIPPVIIDAKYKLHYQSTTIHKDIRQVSGYARLKSIRSSAGLDLTSDSHIPCVIVYPTLDGKRTKLDLSGIMTPENQIKAYHQVYKAGISIPFK